MSLNYLNIAKLFTIIDDVKIKVIIFDTHFVEYWMHLLLGVV